MLDVSLACEKAAGSSSGLLARPHNSANDKHPGSVHSKFSMPSRIRDVWVEYPLHKNSTITRFVASIDQYMTSNYSLEYMYRFIDQCLVPLWKPGRSIPSRPRNSALLSTGLAQRTRLEQPRSIPRGAQVLVTTKDAGLTAHQPLCRIVKGAEMRDAPQV